MKVIQSLLFGTVLCFFTQFSYGQDRGVVKFFVEVDNGYFEIELNDTSLLKRYKDTLTVGHYEAKVWSPGYVINPVSFDIEEGKTTEVHVPMVKNNNYMQYELDYKAYRMQFHKQFTAPLSLTLATSIVAGAYMLHSYSTLNKVQSDIDLYHVTPVASELNEIKLRIAENNKKYNRLRTGFYITGGLTALFAIGTTWSFINFNKNNIEPVYNKESPFKDKFVMNLTPYGCAVTFKL